MPSGRPMHRNVWVTSGTSFLTDVSSEMLQNVLPLFLANVLGVRTWAVGVVEGLAEATASLLKLYSGHLSDRLGARKWLAVAGYGVSALSKPFYYIAASWSAVAGIRWADRVGKGVRTPPRDALLADSVASGRRGLAFGIHRGADTAGAVVGLLITIAVVDAVQGGGLLLQNETFRSLVLWSLVPAFLAVVLLAAGARDVPLEASDGQRRPPRIRFRGLGRGFGAFVAVSAIFALGNSSDAFLILRAQERGLELVPLLWTLLAFNFVYTVLSAPAGHLADLFPRKWVLLGGWLIYAGVYVGFALADSAVDAAVLFTVYGAYHGVVAGATKALITDLVPPSLRGTAFGTYHAVVGFTLLPASLLAGVLWEGAGAWQGFGPAAPFAFGAGTALAAAVLLVVLVPEGGEPTTPDPDSIDVVAAVVQHSGRYLLGRRPDHKRHGALWEFPGGKVGTGEDLEAAARRELAEELGLELTAIGELRRTVRDGDSPFLIHFVDIHVSGTPRPIEHSEVGWFTAAELEEMPLAPADARFVRGVLAGTEPGGPASG